MFLIHYLFKYLTATPILRGNFDLKGCVRYIFASFSSPKESTCNTSENVFFLRKSNFKLLDIQVLWLHQMLKHKTRNTFYWITCEVNTVCLCHTVYDQFISCYKRKSFIKKFYKNWDLKTSSRRLFVSKELSATSFEKLNFWKKLLHSFLQDWNNCIAKCDGCMKLIYIRISLDIC